MTRYITLRASNATKPKDIYLYGNGITHSRTISEVAGGVDSVTRSLVIGTVIQQAGQWARRPPLPPQDVLMALKVWLEPQNDKTQNN